MGQSAADSVEQIIDRARLNSTGMATLLVGGGILMFGATGLFNQLKTSFNAVWHLKAKPEKTVLRLLVNRAVSLGMAIIIGFLLLMSMYLSAGLKVLSAWLVEEAPDLGFIKIFESSISFLTLTILFALIFKILPDVLIKLKYALAGGILCSLLFMAGEWGFAQALDYFFPKDVFGAAGSIILIMVWVTYGCMILQFGAEFIRSMMNSAEEDIKISRFVDFKK